jgi:hypothetical protein
MRVCGRTKATLVQAVSTGSAAAAHPVTNEAFRKWYDLRTADRDELFLTAYDDRNDVFKIEDLDRLREYSTVLAFPGEAEAIREVLTA